MKRARRLGRDLQHCRSTDYRYDAMFDLLMLSLLLAAFAGAAAYVRACLDLTRPAQPPERQSKP